MRCHRRLLPLTMLVLSQLLVGCGQEETPEQRVQRLRSRHEIYPAGVTTVYDNDGRPTLVVDVQVANQGTETLQQLSVMVRVQSADGETRHAERVALDLSDIRPGIGARRTATIPGLELEEGDEVFVELEANLPPEVLRQLPEFEEFS